MSQFEGRILQTKRLSHHKFTFQYESIRRPVQKLGEVTAANIYISIWVNSKEPRSILHYTLNYKFTFQYESIRRLYIFCSANISNHSFTFQYESIRRHLFFYLHRLVLHYLHFNMSQFEGNWLRGQHRQANTFTFQYESIRRSL